MNELEDKLQTITLEELAGQKEPSNEANRAKDTAFHRNVPIQAQRDYIDNRVRVLEAAQQVLKQIWTDFMGQGLNVVEFGSGAWGTLYNLLMPKEARER